MTRALLLVDLQEDFLASRDLAPARGDLVARAARLLDAFRRRGLPVFHARTLLPPDGAGALPHWRGRLRCVAGTPGASAPAGVEPLAGEAVARKTGYDAFGDGFLEEALRRAGARELVVAGVHLHACVRHAALSALAAGLEVAVAEDATGSDDPVHAAATRRWLARRGVVFAPGDALSGDAPLRWTPPVPEPAVLRAAGEARDAFPPWAALPHAERASRLEAAAARVAERADSVADEIVREIRKPLRDACGEVARAVALLHAAARLAAAPDAPAGKGVRARRVPHGVVAVVTPWNNPVAIPAGKLAPAIAFGNAVVWKPSPVAPRTAELLRSAILSAGVPPEVLGLVSGGADTARDLMDDARVDAIALTGSPAAGSTAREIAARRSVPLHAELGGNNAAIVAADADLATAARAVAHGAFSFAGQRCTANRRVVVDAAVRDAFLRALVDSVASIRRGAPEDPDTEMGPLVSREAAERVAGALDRAVARGGRAILPGGPFEPEGGALPPGLLVVDDDGDEVVREETFGPVLVVQTARDPEHALALLNGVPQGLVAALFTADAPRRARFLAAARAGLLKLGRSTVDASVEAPFGGWKASGIGAPEHGPANVEAFTRWQAVYA